MGIVNSKTLKSDDAIEFKLSKQDKISLVAPFGEGELTLLTNKLFIN